MIRRFNYTGRVKIPRDRVDLVLAKDARGKYFMAHVILDGLNFPSEAKIIIEPNYKGVYQRFYFGTVGSFKPPDDTVLSDLPDTDIVYFDISVIDEKNKLGLILGKASGIAISTDGTPSDRIPLLHVNPVDLGDQIWKLSFESSEDGRPIIEINKSIPNFNETVRNDPQFVSLVYPIAFREVLQKLVERGDLDIDDDSWTAQWLKFITQGLGVKDIPDLSDENHTLTREQELWIDECVNEFCKKFKLFEKFTLTLS